MRQTDSPKNIMHSTTLMGGKGIKNTQNAPSIHTLQKLCYNVLYAAKLNFNQTLNIQQKYKIPQSFRRSPT